MVIEKVSIPATAWVNPVARRRNAPPISRASRRAFLTARPSCRRPCALAPIPTASFRVLGRAPDALDPFFLLGTASQRGRGVGPHDPTEFRLPLLGQAELRRVGGLALRGGPVDHFDQALLAFVEILEGGRGLTLRVDVLDHHWPAPVWPPS